MRIFLLITGVVLLLRAASSVVSSFFGIDPISCLVSVIAEMTPWEDLTTQSEELDAAARFLFPVTMQDDATIARRDCGLLHQSLHGNIEGPKFHPPSYVVLFVLFQQICPNCANRRLL
jgi:hypothetical protein